MRLTGASAAGWSSRVAGLPVRGFRAAAAPLPRSAGYRERQRHNGSLPAAAALPADAIVILADVAEAGGVSIPAAAAGALGVLAVGSAGLRFYNYSQLEYVTAAMMTNWVPKGGKGAKVIQMGGGARQLYYYPKDTVQVTNIGEAVNKSLMEQAGVQAAVPTVGRKQPVWDLSFAADASMDAVVSLQSLAPLPPDKRRTLFAEAARVLRPGGAFVFIERVAASERAAASPLRALITAGSADGGLTITLPEIDALGKGPAGAGALWQGVQYDLALEGQDPHALGVAVRGQGRAPGVGGSGGPGAAEAAGERAEKKRERRGKPTGAKGF